MMLLLELDNHATNKHVVQYVHNSETKHPRLSKPLNPLRISFTMYLTSEKVSSLIHRLPSSSSMHDLECEIYIIV